MTTTTLITDETTTTLTRGQKAALTRAKNKLRNRAFRAWETRRANLAAKGLVDKNGDPTPKEQKRRRKIALRAWETRRETHGETGRSVSAAG